MLNEEVLIPDKSVLPLQVNLPEKGVPDKSVLPLQVNLPEKGVSYRSTVKPGSFQSRDNISNFITWCRGLGIDDVLMFETDDLVLRKNERSVVLCLLEVTAHYLLQTTHLIYLEEKSDHINL